MVRKSVCMEHDQTTNTLAQAGQSERTRRLDERHRQQRQKSNQDSRLLRLAPELRNRIFAFALPSDKIVTTDPTSHSIEIAEEEYECPTVCDAASYQQEFGITQVCRQIRAETLKVAYASSTFILAVNPAGRRAKNEADRWVVSRPPDVLQLVSKMVLHLGPFPNNWWKCGELGVIIHVESKTAEALRGGCEECSPQNERLIMAHNEKISEDLPAHMTPKYWLLRLIQHYRLL